MSDNGSSSVVVGGGGQKRPSGRRGVLRGTRGKIILGAIAAVLVLCTAIVIYYFMLNPKDTAVNAENTTQKKASQAVSKIVENPDYAVATTELNNQLKQTDDKKKQAEIYVGLSSLAMQQGKYQDVVNNQLQAVKADPSQADALARNTADAYAQLGNKAEALKYYKQALAYYQAKPESFMGRSYYITTIQAKITELEK